MKKNGMKKLMLGAVLVLSTGMFFIGCKSSNDSDNNPSGSIDPVVGTFKGTIEDGENPDIKYYNAFIIVSKVDDSRVKVTSKSGEAYSGYTTKTIKVANPVGASVVGGDEQGDVSYLIDTKSLTVSTKKNSAQDKTYIFNGSKQ
ncbi:MAG: hypothetical protein LBE39_18525 [Flavobacteriaceae bacterium]|jgi:hypothetical protein|uniref:Lipoprotein n=1 Tax=Elizabethkingia ursingii TaxID=1756150 RepID=A0ABX3N7P2_9FLAO|nr:hypothetical protein [Elizabethkingia ursingii]MCL1672446.1 hypothetical protein [Elizabethkingia ursingii]MDR2231470.1 hypothetical protein [Flavobacteriaceae bacterium]OPB87583.1 hypothetical protein BB021_09965 [Elizabethkingia ursingii]